MFTERDEKARGGLEQAVAAIPRAHVNRQMELWTNTG